MPKKSASEAQVLDSGAADSSAPAIPFEQALGELERIVGQMEGGSLSLEQSLSSYQRGVALVASCRQSLTSARQQVKILEGDLMKPFDLDAEG